MDVVSVAIFAYLGACLAGGLVGWLIGYFTRFETGLGVGLLLPGAVALYFSLHCLAEYREFSVPGPQHVQGEIIAIEDVPVGANGSQPAPLVRYTTAAGTTHTVLGPRAGSGKVGDRLTVIHDAGNPQRARIANVRDLRGCAIAYMLFGTFPLSFGLYMLLGPLLPQPRAASPSRARTVLVVVFNLVLLAGVLWPVFADGEVEELLMVGFGIVTFGLLGHALRGALDRSTSPAWSLGMFVLALNFAVWVAALYLLA